MSTPAQLDELEAASPAADVDDVDEAAGDAAEPDTGDTLEPEAAPAPEPDADADGQPDAGYEAERRRQIVERDEIALAQAERDKRLKALETYIGKKLTELFGEEAANQLEPCELCTWTKTYGWRVPMVPPEQVVEAVKRAIGIGTLDQFKAFPAFQTCAACGGECYVLTGAKSGTELTRKCPVCKGRGYSSSLPEDADRPPAASPIVAEAPGEGLPPAMPTRDMFGTPEGHPDYGKMPQYREVPVAHWQAESPAT